MNASSPSRGRNWTLLLLAACLLLAVAAALVGIDDNLPGILLALFAALAFVLAFAHPWRSARNFLYLLLASILGFVLFTALNILMDMLSQKPDAPPAFLALTQSPAAEAIMVIIIMLCLGAFLIGVFGALTMFIRARRGVEG